MYIYNILYNVIYIFGTWYKSYSIGGGGGGGGIVYFFLGGSRLMKIWCWSEAICGFWFLLGRVMVVFLYLCFNKKDNYK